MRPELEKIERIEKYLLGFLEGEDLLRFEEELSRNPSFKEEVDLQRLLMNGVENISIKKSLNHIHFSTYENSFSFWLRTWGKYVVGGFFLLGVLVGGWIILNSKDNSVPDTLTKVSRVDLSADTNTTEEGFEKYEEFFSQSLGDKDKSVPVFYEHSNPLERYFSSDNSAVSYFVINPYRDTIVTGKKGTRISIPSYSFVNEEGMPASEGFIFQLKEVYKKSEIIINDLVSKSSDNLQTASVYLNAQYKERQLRLDDGKKIGVNFLDNYFPHVDNPHSDSALAGEASEFVNFKVFEEKNERRIIILPAIVLDYDIIYTRKSADPLVNERVESLLLPQYENTFTSTTQFHYRIEGSLLYGKGAELLDIYLNNTHLKLWQADSLVMEYLYAKAYEDCRNFTRYMKAAEYFRWLKSLKHGKVDRVSQLDYRNYRKGQFYNKLPDLVLEKYLKESGLSTEESEELIGYFKKMFYFQKMFYRKTKYSQLDQQNSSLDYYYNNEGKFIGFSKNKCSDKVRVERSNNYIYKSGNNLGAATELNYFMPVNRLGWINSERFINYKNTVSLNVSLSGIDTSCYSKVYIVFNDVYAVLGGKWSKEGFNYFDRIPKGSRVYLVGLSYNNNQLYYGRKEIVIGSESEEVMEMKLTDEVKVRIDLLQLDL